MSERERIGHTPGPWFTDPAYAEAEFIPIYCSADDEWAIAQAMALPLYEENEFIIDAKVEANARLIAAAPELLQALIALADLDERSGWHSAALDAARAAISKATGDA